MRRFEPVRNARYLYPLVLRWLARRLPEVLVRCGVHDLDLSAATGPQRELTQAIARELCLHGDTHAIDYPSRYGETIRCIAAYETDGGLPRHRADRYGLRPVARGR
jgi:hypothetical protein